MDHAEAIQTQAAEKYLLGEFSATQQEEFAEHFFDCEECAKDVRLTALFMDTAKRVMAADLADKPQLTVQSSSGSWHTAWYAVAASIALLAVILYQNVITIPKLRSFAAPQALEYFSIAGMGSRGAGQTAVTPSHERPFIMLADIPPHENVDQYRCEILNSDGKAVLSIDVPEALARKTVPLLIPASTLSRGTYSFAISGRSSKQDASYTQFEKYPFQVM
jgi:hypothetical protein